MNMSAVETQGVTCNGFIFFSTQVAHNNFLPLDAVCDSYVDIIFHTVVQFSSQKYVQCKLFKKNFLYSESNTV